MRPDLSRYPESPQQPPSAGYPPNPQHPAGPHDPQAPLHGGHAARPRRQRRIVLIAGGTLVVLIAALVAVGMAGGHNQKAASASLSRTSSGSPDCQSLAAAWAPGGEKHQQAFSTALGKVESDDNELTSDIQAGNNLTTDTNTLAGDLGSLEGAVYNIKYDLPPSCIPGLVHDYESAMDAYGNYDLYQILATGALNKGNTAGAQTDLALATASELAGNSAMQSALDDLNAFNASGSSAGAAFCAMRSPRQYSRRVTAYPDPGCPSQRIGVSSFRQLRCGNTRTHAR